MEIKVEDNLRLVNNVLNKHFGGGRNYKFMGFEPEDMFQVGVIGLMKAVERYDPSLGFQFSTYAYSIIYGEIKRELRDNGMMIHFPRRVNETVAKIVLQGRKDTITVEEIARDFNVDEDYAGMIMVRLFYNTTSGDTLIHRDESKSTYFDTMKDESIDVESEVVSAVELESRLSVLNERERQAVELSLQGLTQTEVASIIGTTQMTVSRLLKKSLQKIEKRFDKVSAV